MSESAFFGRYDCSGTDTLGTDAVSETTLRAGAGWGATTVDCGLNSDENVGKGGGGVSGISMACGTEIPWLRSVLICFI